jgi:uncharacterized membrane protein YesL
VSPWAERFPRLWAFLEQIAALLCSSFLFWLCVPLVITLPAGLVGLYAVLGPLIRTGRADGEILRPFWVAFRRAFLPSLALLLIDLVVGLILWVDLRFFSATGALWGLGLAALASLIGVLVLMINLFAWPLLAWYPQGLRKLLWRAFLLAGAHPLWGLSGVVVGLLFVSLPVFLPGPFLVVIPLLGPGLSVGLLGSIAWRVMRLYDPGSRPTLSSGNPPRT